MSMQSSGVVGTPPPRRPLCVKVCGITCAEDAAVEIRAVDHY